MRAPSRRRPSRKTACWDGLRDAGRYKNRVVRQNLIACAWHGQATQVME